jgi:hypothetical protein
MPAIPAPTISVWRRVQWRFANSDILYLPSEPAVDRRFPVLSEKEDFPGRAIVSWAHSTLRGNHRIRNLRRVHAAVNGTKLNTT